MLSALLAMLIRLKRLQLVPTSVCVKKKYSSLYMM